METQNLHEILFAPGKVARGLFYFFSISALALLLVFTAYEVIQTQEINTEVTRSALEISSPLDHPSLVQGWSNMIAKGTYNNQSKDYTVTYYWQSLALIVVVIIFLSATIIRSEFIFKRRSRYWVILIVNLGISAFLAWILFVFWVLSQIHNI